MNKQETKALRPGEAGGTGCCHKCRIRLEETKNCGNFPEKKAKKRMSEVKKVSKSCSSGRLKDRRTVGVDTGLWSGRVNVEMSP